MKALRVGDPLDEATQMGPLISAAQRETVALVPRRTGAGRVPRQRARGPGLLVRADRARPGGAERPRRAGGGVRADRRRDLRSATRPRRSRLANDTIYGLSGSIWTRDGARALRVARAIETGVLSINANTSVRVTTPFGGFKQSGYGRELGPHALEAYTEVKTIFYATEG